MITKEKVEELFYYKEGNLYWKVTKGSRANKDNLVGTITHFGYRQTTIDGKKYYVHRLIWLFTYGYFPNELDHINRNKLDNSLENLRECTRSQNICNNKSRTSNPRGVSFHPSSNLWRARVHINGKEKHLGCFNSIEEASNVVKEARERYYGNFTGSV